MKQTCKTCEWYYKEHCCKGISEYCTESVSQDFTCKDWEDKLSEVVE